jgi:S-adenosylmethionine hydrolase
VITLSSDFGRPYPAAMKGVVLGESDARLVDVSHGFPRQDVRTAAFWLREVLPYFPPAVHLAVVDPGVGTDRDALVLAAGEHRLVAPDNGLVLPAARRLGGELAAFTADYDAESHTFHGRDVFAPLAARVHEHDGPLADLEALSPTEPVDLRFPEPALGDDGGDEGGLLGRGEVLVVDGFGNAVTNLPGRLLEGRDGIVVNGGRVPVVRAYAAVEPGTAVATVGSHGNVELAVNRGRGDEAFGLGVGDDVTLSVAR